MDIPEKDRIKVANRWTLRQFIIDVRAGIKEAKRLKREASRKRNKQVDSATVTV